MSSDAHTTGVRSAYDLVLVGGGLQNGLIALACFARNPALRIALVERERLPGGNHTWAIHPEDIAREAESIVAPLIAHRWLGYDVRFPSSTRTLSARYAAITSERFAQVLTAAFAQAPRSRLLLGRRARAIGSHEIELEAGEVITAPLVIDARGPNAFTSPMGTPGGTTAGKTTVRAGFQKFLGLELSFAREHGVTRPILMDATVTQIDGFRFFYVLPLDPHTLLVEDTVFSRSPLLLLDEVRARVLDYAERFGAPIEVRREERGVLPMPYGDGVEPQLASPLTLGYQGGFFHPATGYSFPVALRLSLLVAEQAPSRVIGRELHALVAEHQKQARFARGLNRLLFTGFNPTDMRNVFERFYTLPEDLIHRFYALRTTQLDRARILLGRPPRGFSMSQALSEIP